MQSVPYELAGPIAIPYGFIIPATALPPPLRSAVPFQVHISELLGFWKPLRLLPERGPSPSSSLFTPSVVVPRWNV